VVADGKMRDVSWSGVDPRQVRTMAATMLGSERPADRLGLAVYCLRTGQMEAARPLLESLAGTDLEIPARPFMRELEK